MSRVWDGVSYCTVDDCSAQAVCESLVAFQDAVPVVVLVCPEHEQENPE